MYTETQEINTLIYLSCELMHIRVPYIYYVGYDEDFMLFDDNMNTISFDKRDIPINHVKSISFVKKEYTIYINISLLIDITKARIYILRHIRGLYQYTQANRYRIGLSTIESEYTSRGWLYALSQKNLNNGYNAMSVTEMDKNAYSVYLMDCIYKVHVNYDVSTNENNNNERYDEIFKYIKQRYSEDLINELGLKYKLIRKS